MLRILLLKAAVQSWDVLHKFHYDEFTQKEKDQVFSVEAQMERHKLGQAVRMALNDRQVGQLDGEIGAQYWSVQANLVQWSENLIQELNYRQSRLRTHFNAKTELPASKSWNVWERTSGMRLRYR